MTSRKPGLYFKVVEVAQKEMSIGVLLTPSFAENVGDDLMSSSNSAFRALGAAMKRGAIQLLLKQGEVEPMELQTKLGQ